MSTTPVLRPLYPEDIPAWNRLLADVEAADRTGEHYNEADLAEEMDNPELEVGKDLVGAFLGGDLVGYFGVFTRGVADGEHRVVMEGTVRPDQRGKGIGTILAAAMRDRALAYHAERHPDLTPVLTFTGRSDATDQERLLGEIGLVPHRWNFVMRAQLGGTLPRPGPLPDGLRLLTYDESFAQALFAAHNVAFLDHPSFVPWTESMWEQWVTGSRNFRPELSFVIVDEAQPDQVVAYVQSYEFDAHFEQTGRREGYVGKVGTLPGHRGRGLASALLVHALHAYRAAGLDQASLDVDSENPTGALGVYRRAGFEVEARWTNYALTLEP